jgi:hypothetical protein
MTSLTEKKITNILLMKAPISTEPRNLELARKITPERNYDQQFRPYLVYWN